MLRHSAVPEIVQGHLRRAQAGGCLTTGELLSVASTLENNPHGQGGTHAQAENKALLTAISADLFQQVS